MDFSRALLGATSAESRQPEASGSGSRSASGSASGKAGEGVKPKEKPRTIRACDAKRPCTYEPQKKGPPRSYVEALEQRLEAMEGLLRNLSVQVGVEMSDLLDCDDEEKTLALEKAVEVLTERQKLETGSGTPPGTLRPTGLDDIVPLGCTAADEHPYTRETNMSLDTDRFVGASSGPAFAKGILRELVPDMMTPLQDEGQKSSIVDQLLRDDVATRARAFVLPPADLSASLILSFFAHVNELLPIIHRPSFERALAAGMLETDPSFRRLVLMIFALGCRSHKDPRIPVPPLVLTVDPGHKEHAAGFDYFMAASGDTINHLTTASLFDIQNSVLGVIWLFGAATPIVAWQRVGFAIRRAVDVGAHSEQRTRWTLSPLEDQLRKRAFHTLFSLDRTVSSQLGRPLAMQDFECDLAYPLDISDAALDDWNLRGSQSPPPPPSTVPTPVTPFLLLMKLLKIHARTLRTLYSTTLVVESVKEIGVLLADLDSQLNAWTLPFPALAICSNAARSLIHVLDTLRERGTLTDLFWNAPLYGATSGMILTIILIRQGPAGMNDTSSAAMSDMQRCLKVLNFLAPSTCMARKVAQVLTKLLKVAQLHNARLEHKPPASTEFSRRVASGSTGTGHNMITTALKYVNRGDLSSPSSPAFAAPTPVQPPAPMLAMPEPLSPFPLSSDSSSLQSGLGLDQPFSLPSGLPSPFENYGDSMFASATVESPAATSFLPWDNQDFSMLNPDEGEWGEWPFLICHGLFSLLTR
ncbi:hypothetical protein RQP46_004443 [Phenoliferia psychrophenolica]